jgi:predicted glycoside hydrolase/deacetylase ChbG (UPF0249 family)
MISCRHIAPRRSLSVVVGCRCGWQLLGVLLPLLILGQSVQGSGPKQDEPRRQLIIHVDDAGMCHAANVATIEGFESGLVTSASVMLNCSWAAEFAQYARQHPEYDYGVHFTLTSEWSGYRWGPVAGRHLVPSLVDPQGYLWGSVAQVAEHAKAEEVEIELRAQIELAKQLQIPLSHLDTHMGSVMARPDLVEVYVKLGLEYDLPILWLRRMDEQGRREYPSLAAALELVVEQLDQRRLPMLDTLLQFYGGDDLVKREQTYLEAIEQLPAGITQLIIHSAKDGPELQAITTSHARRDHDRELFSRPSVKQWILDQGIELTSWKQLTAEARQ